MVSTVLNIDVQMTDVRTKKIIIPITVLYVHAQRRDARTLRAEMDITAQNILVPQADVHLKNHMAKTIVSTIPVQAAKTL